MEPQRTCIGCRQRGPKSGLVRLVIQSGEVLVDQFQRLPGRGCYLHAACAQTVIQRRVVGRALRASVNPEQAGRILISLELASAGSASLGS